MSILKSKLKPTRFPVMSPLMAAIVGYVLGACPSNNRNCDGMDFGGHQEAATRAYLAKMIRRGSRAAESGRKACRPEGVPEISEITVQLNIVYNKLAVHKLES